MLVSSTLPIRGRSVFAAGQPSRGHPPCQTLGRPPLLEEAPTDGSPNDLEVAVHRLCDFRAGRNDANSGGTTPERCHILIGVDIVACLGVSCRAPGGFVHCNMLADDIGGVASILCRRPGDGRSGLVA